MLKVTDKTQNISGYWGAVDTTTNFCEPHYSLSPYIAEFFNSCSSFVYVVVGAYLLYKLRHQNDKAVNTSALWLVAIGVGSALFHGTMRYSMQLADELPMVGFVLSGMLAKTTVTFHEGVKKWSKHIRIAGCCQALLLVVLYGYFKLYEIFVNGFALLVVSDVALGHVLNNTTGPHVERRKTAWLYAVVFIILGRVVWETENMYCGTNPQIWPMHSLWHFLSATSAYNAVVHVCLCRMDDSQQLPSLIGWASDDDTTTKKMR